MLHASVVTQTEGLSGLRDEWFDLIERSSGATVFDTYEWQVTWWRHIGRRIIGAKLSVVLLRDDSGLLVGILPLYSRFWAVWPLRQLVFLGMGSSDYHDVIAASGFEDAVCQELIGWLIADARWSIADLGQLRESGNLRRYVRPRTIAGLRALELVQEECPYLALPDAPANQKRWELLLGEFSKKMRGNVRYYNRALDRIYSVERRVAGTMDEVSDALDALFLLHQRRWNQRWLPGVFYSGSARAFHKEIAGLLLPRGWLRLHYLTLDGSIEAVLYCFYLNGVTAYYQGGFEPALAKLSLGSVLTGIAIQTAALEGCSTFDFLRGDEPYKRRWTQGDSAWNKRWILARQDFPLFSAAAALVQFELRVEQRIKVWLHHRGSGNKSESEGMDGT